MVKKIPNEHSNIVRIYDGPRNPPVQQSLEINCKEMFKTCYVSISHLITCCNLKQNFLCYQRLKYNLGVRACTAPDVYGNYKQWSFYHSSLLTMGRCSTWWPRPHSNYTTTVSDPTSTENNILKTTAAETKHSWTKAVATLIQHHYFYFTK